MMKKKMLLGLHLQNIFIVNKENMEFFYYFMTFMNRHGGGFYE